MFFITPNIISPFLTEFLPISTYIRLYFCLYLTKGFSQNLFHKIRHLCTFAQKQVLYDVRCNALSALSILNKFTKNEIQRMVDGLFLTAFLRVSVKLQRQSCDCLR